MDASLVVCTRISSLGYGAETGGDLTSACRQGDGEHFLAYTRDFGAETDRLGKHGLA